MLDYCNSLLTGVTDDHFKRLLQSIQTVARSITGERSHDTITPVLTTLYWLPVQGSDVQDCGVGVEGSCRRRFRLPLSTLRSCCLCFRSSVSQVSLNGLNASSQNPKHNRPAELRRRGTVVTGQSSSRCCLTETGDHHHHHHEIL